MKTDCDFESVVPYASNTSTRLCFSRTRRFSRLMSIALGRTKICGSKLESIFRRSRGKRPYLAINSLFLNSPLTSVTLPCSSSSVHRILSSFVGRTIRPKLLPKPVEPGVSSAGAVGAFSCASVRRRADLNMSQTLCGRLVEKVRSPINELKELEVEHEVVRCCGELLKACRIDMHCCCSIALAVDNVLVQTLLMHPALDFCTLLVSPLFVVYLHRCLLSPAHWAVGDSNAVFT